MDRNGLLVMALSILVVIGASHASSGANRGVLAAEGKGNSNGHTQHTKVPATPSPVPVANSAPVRPHRANVKQQPGGADCKSNGTATRNGQAQSGVPALAPPSLLESVPPPQDLGPPSPALVFPPPALVPPPPSSQLEGRKKDENSKGSSGFTESGSRMNTGQEDRCAEMSEKCKTDDFVACLLRPDGMKESFLLVQNGGENNLTVIIKASVPFVVEQVQVAKHSSEKISVLSNVTEVVHITLNAGKEDCNIQIRPSVSDWNPLQHFPAYAAQVTPIHGVYFLFFIMVIAGGTWACCKFGKKARRAGTGIPYQQLEMGTHPQSSSVLDDLNATDGWEQSWDDDWDEEVAVGRPSERQPVEDTQANRLSSKPCSKDGWDDDWDN